MPHVTILRGNRTEVLSAYQGETLLDLFARCGLSFYAPCGGGHTCGKCRVKASGGLSPMDGEEAALLGGVQESGIRLACFARVEGEATVTMEEAAFTAQTGLPGPAAEAGRPQADEPVGFAADIGTTTVVVYGLGLKSGRLICAKSALNPQRTFGADVITRIDAAARGALAELRAAIVGTLNELLAHIRREAGNKPLQKGVIAANTTMLHLLCGLDPAPIAQAPFTPNSLFGRDLTAGELGLSLDPHAPVHLIRCLSAYVGGDITAGILAADIGKPGENSLLIDIGTNGEMALGKGKTLFCCSVAAGPALEGAKIRYGMGGAPGAVNQVGLDKEGLSVGTIGNLPPVGICGSGLLDAAAVLLDAGAVDETGRLSGEGLIPELAGRLIELDGQPAFLLDRESGVAVTQQDIRELQLAKAAFAAGIEILLKEAELTPEEIDRVVLAGSFGCALNPRSACRIGLLPQAFLQKAQAGGNTAGAGAVKVLLDDGAKARLTQIAWDAAYLELSGRTDFNDAYVEAMLFPDGEE